MEPLKLDIIVNTNQAKKSLDAFATDTGKKYKVEIEVGLKKNIAEMQQEMKSLQKQLKGATGKQEIELLIKKNELSGAITETKRQLKNLQTQGDTTTSRLQAKFDGLRKSFVNIGLAVGIVVGAFNTIKRFFGGIISEGQEAIRVEAQLTNLLKQTGKETQITTEQISKMADEMSKKTGIDDEAIIALDTILLRYKNISGETLPEMTQAVIDLTMAQNGGLIPSQEELSASAQKLGFILNDPISGYKKLRAVGINFTEQQKEQIETAIKVGNGFKVQSLLLDKLNQIYGDASMSTDDLTKSTALLNLSRNNFKENLGKAIIPWLSKLVSSLNIVLESVLNLGANIRSLGGVGGVIGKTWTTLKAVITGKPLTMEQQLKMQPKLITNTGGKTPAQTQAQQEVDKIKQLFEEFSVKSGGGISKTKKSVEDLKDTFKDTFTSIDKDIDGSKKKIDEYSDSIKELSGQLEDLQTDIANRILEIDQALSATGEDAVSGDERAKLESERAEAFIGLTEAETQALKDKIAEQDAYNKLSEIGKLKADFLKETGFTQEQAENELKIREEQLKSEEELYKQLNDAKIALERDYTEQFKEFVNQQNIAVQELQNKIYSTIGLMKSAQGTVSSISNVNNNQKTTTINATVNNTTSLDYLYNKFSK